MSFTFCSSLLWEKVYLFCVCIPFFFFSSPDRFIFASRISGKCIQLVFFYHSYFSINIFTLPRRSTCRFFWSHKKKLFKWTKAHKAKIPIFVKTIFIHTGIIHWHKSNYIQLLKFTSIFQDFSVPSSTTVSTDSTRRRRLGTRHGWKSRREWWGSYVLLCEEGVVSQCFLCSLACIWQGFRLSIWRRGFQSWYLGSKNRNRNNTEIKLWTQIGHK